MKRLIEFIKSPRGETVRYLLVGGATTLVSVASYAALTRLFRLDYRVGNVVSIALAIAFAYVTNKLIVFRARAGTPKRLLAELLSFVGARLVTMALEAGAVPLLVERLGQSELTAKLEAQLVVIAANYVLGKFLVFRKTPQ
ncbi:MAG: GtrA family protein [Oscillospiraceae bacterium]|jgi:putative flippase GtrA|nr:GtrA family protein [Oscillospiraceae bacterium]